MAVEQSQAGGEQFPGAPVTASITTATAPSNELDDIAAEAALIAATEVVADNLVEYVRGWWRRVRAGDSGVLPVVVALVVIVVAFQAREPKYLSAGNLVDLFDQMVIFALFAMAEVFVLLLGEIDLSVVYNAGIGAGLMAAFVAPPFKFAWWICILIGVATTTLIGLVLGTLITRLRLPSFIVTLAAFLGLEGVMLFMFNKFSVAVGGVILISNHVLVDLVAGNITPGWSWVTMAILVVAFGVYSVVRDVRRKAAGLVTPPLSLTLLKALAVAVAGVVVVAICNVNRGSHAIANRGVPWSIPILLGIFGATTILLSRTRFGRYVYAIGGNAEAARRAGINVAMVRTAAFGLTGLLSGLAGMMYLSWLGSISTDIDPSLMLYAVAAAVIGGTSLFGGRGKALHGVLGGLVIAAVYNGIDLMGLGAAYEDMVVALVLLVSITVDSIARGGQRAR
jgi:D-xylose transport system permease protein